MALKPFLLDTNTAIDYISGTLPTKATNWLDSIIERDIAISVINQIEMLGFNPANPADLIPFEELAKIVEVLPLDSKVVARTIALRKAHKIKLPDAIVAATALEYGCSVLSRNTADFKKIPNLLLLNLHEMV